ncbi:helix-turn-helix transcriptional regulator [Streptomyces acidicola]|uniref:helix-turn-helix transcriptional regulator n=1 Tax=Streptomyces acidicola TaxID=2596892 RepID=UPI0037FD78A8
MTRIAPGTHGAGAPIVAAQAELFGRREETTVLDELLSQARDGAGGALVLWGEPGIGKSALLRCVHDQAADFVRLSYSATRPESDLAFAGRGRRRIDARVQIGGAIEVFDRLGAEPLHRRAQREQDLTGQPGRRGSPDTREVNRLTAQEQRVAQLVAKQLTNREIAIQMRISHRTVGHHLGNVFAKFGINTRTELSYTHAGSEPR